MPAPARDPIQIATIARLICETPGREYSTHPDGKLSHNEASFAQAIGGIGGLQPARGPLQLGDVLLFDRDAIGVAVEHRSGEWRIAVIDAGRAPGLCWYGSYWKDRLVQHLRAAAASKREAA